MTRRSTIKTYSRQECEQRDRALRLRVRRYIIGTIAATTAVVIVGVIVMLMINPGTEEGAALIGVIIGTAALPVLFTGAIRAGLIERERSTLWRAALEDRQQSGKRP